MKRSLRIALIAACAGVALPAAAQTVDELRQELDAQRAINAQLRQRLEQLERQLSGAEPPALRPLEPGRAVAAEPETPEGATAIQEALVARGLVLLPRGSFRLAPGLSWLHSGSDALRSRSDTYSASLALQAGLPWGMMFSANAPYVHRDTALGSNSGPGDFSFALSKKLTEDTERLPSFVATLNYRERTGKDPFARIPIGFGFRGLGARLSALKRLDPVALYGEVSVFHVFGRDVSADNLLGEARFAGRISPGNNYGFSLGASLAATPDITFDAGLSMAFVRPTEVNSAAFGTYRLPKATVGFFTLGSGFILGRNLSLLLSVAAGVTNDSPDFMLSVSLPYRF
jgi:hypothetical protein